MELKVPSTGLADMNVELSIDIWAIFGGSARGVIPDVRVDFPVEDDDSSLEAAVRVGVGDIGSKTMKPLPLCFCDPLSKTIVEAVELTLSGVVNLLAVNFFLTGVDELNMVW